MIFAAPNPVIINPVYIDNLLLQILKNIKIVPKFKSSIFSLDLIYGILIIKYIGNNLWELRPIRDRIFFVSWENNSYVLLHHFMKKTQKTPKNEIEKAKRNLQDLIERGVIYE